MGGVVKTVDELIEYRLPRSDTKAWARITYRELDRLVKTTQSDARSDLLDRIKVLERWRRRLEWLHEGCDKDAEGYEWGVARVKFDEHGKVASFLWTDSDHKDLDAEIERTSK